MKYLETFAAKSQEVSPVQEWTATFQEPVTGSNSGTFYQEQQKKKRRKIRMEQID